MRVLLSVCLMFLWFYSTPAVAESFPDGRDGVNVWDYGAVLSDRQKEELQESCDFFRKEHPGGIWVVTVKSLAHYGSSPEEINAYSQRFLKEKLGKFGANGESILLLLSREDRLCRIQLGEDWGAGWDYDCEDIMASRGLPKFREKKNFEGLQNLVFSMGVLADKRAQTRPLVLQLREWGAWVAPHSPLPTALNVPLLCVAVLFTLGGLLNSSRHTRGLTWLGILFGAAILFGGFVRDFFRDDEVSEITKLIVVLLFAGGIKLFAPGLSGRGARSHTGYAEGGTDGASGGGGGATGSW